MKKLPVEKDFGWSPAPYGTWGKPYAIYFVYTPTRSFVAKGPADRCDRYISEKITEPCMVFYTFWSNKKSRGATRFYHFPEDIYVKFAEYSRSRYRPEYDSDRELQIYKGRKLVFRKKLRRIPRKWMVELNPFVGL